ncbi:MAG: M48 family metallopeptidase [Steroidobacteraceae bacterium]
MAQLMLLGDSPALRDRWSVRRSERARRLAVRVLPGGAVEIVVPKGIRPGTVERFVTRHRQWIERKVAQYAPLEPTPADCLPDHIHFSASGHRFEIRYLDSPDTLRLTTTAGVVQVKGDMARPTLIRHVLQRFAMRQAHDIFDPWLAGLSRETGLHYTRTQVRRQRTRWGSCSRNGTISLNACLLFQQPAIVNYLLLHELAHTRHMNHSRRYWALVQGLEPRARELDAELSLGWRAVPAWVLR